MLCSQFFPSWYLGGRPDHRVLFASYNETFAEGWGRKSRAALEEFGPSVFGVRPDPKYKAGGNWFIENRRGEMKTAGRGGSITGRRGELIIVDDPIKDNVEANSETIRNGLWDWWLSTLYSRRLPNTVILVIQTRWHEDDLAGRLLHDMRSGGERWEVINLPAIAEEDTKDPLGRAAGEALWPQMFPVSFFDQVRRNPYWWSALYQGRPQPLGGGIFKREHFRYFREEPHYYVLERPGLPAKRIPKDAGYRFSTTDPAASASTTADYTATATWFLSRDGDLLLLDMWRDRIEGPDQLNGLETGVKRFKLSFAAIESRSYQLTLVQSLVRRGVPVMELKADTDKVSRAMTAGARMSTGSVYFLQGATWLSDLEKELLDFPRGAHDDQVDTVSYAAIHVAKGEGRPTAEAI